MKSSGSRLMYGVDPVRPPMIKSAATRAWRTTEREFEQRQRARQRLAAGILSQTTRVAEGEGEQTVNTL